jgi:hypothetical protein
MISYRVLATLSTAGQLFCLLLEGRVRHTKLSACSLR